MIVDLVQTTTDDGFRLDGVLQCGESGDGESSRRTAVLCLHGVGGNFYGSPLLESVAQELTQAHCDVLRANTRGHDAYSIAQTTSNQRHQGAAFETVDDCRLDIAGWIACLQERNYQQIILLGHSLGAVKAIYSQAHQPHPQVTAVIAISPPRLSCQAFQNGEQSAHFSQTLSEAQQLVESERGESLIQTRVPVPLLISAAGFIDKYGPAERYNFLQFTAAVDCPLLFTFGSLELEHGGVAFAGLPTAIESLANHSTETRWQAEVAVIEGADHHYREGRHELNSELIRWLRRQNRIIDPS